VAQKGKQETSLEVTN